MERSLTMQECKEAIEKQRLKIDRLLEKYKCNHPALDTDNDCLDEMAMEYMFYFDEKARAFFLKKPDNYLSLADVQKLAHEKGLALETDDRKALIRAIQDSDKQPPCYASRGSCGKNCRWGDECMYEFFTELEKSRKSSHSA